MPSFADLHNRLEAVAPGIGGSLDELGRIDGLPVLRIIAGNPDAPVLFIDAGIHGEEPAGPLGLAAWLERKAADWTPRFRLVVLPCLNPWGFGHGTRSSRDVEDLNRHFDEPEAPLTRMVAASLKGVRPVLTLDLHEDVDFDGCYLYELRRSPPFAGELLINAAASIVPVSDGEAVGEWKTVHGLIRPQAGVLHPENRKGWPIAIAHFAHGAPHVITMETPGKRPLEERVAAQVSVLDAACRFASVP